MCMHVCVCKCWCVHVRVHMHVCVFMCMRVIDMQVRTLSAFINNPALSVHECMVSM